MKLLLQVSALLLLLFSCIYVGWYLKMFDYLSGHLMYKSSFFTALTNERSRYLADLGIGEPAPVLTEQGSINHRLSELKTVIISIGSSYVYIWRGLLPWGVSFNGKEAFNVAILFQTADGVPSRLRDLVETGIFKVDQIKTVSGYGLVHPMAGYALSAEEWRAIVSPGDVVSITFDSSGSVSRPVRFTLLSLKDGNR